MTTAADIMHPGAQWIPATATLDEAARLMSRLNVGALPISDAAERLCGIITDRDIVVTCVAQGLNPAEMTCGDMAQGTPAGSTRAPTSPMCWTRWRATASSGFRSSRTRSWSA